MKLVSDGVREGNTTLVSYTLYSLLTIQSLKLQYLNATKITKKVNDIKFIENLVRFQNVVITTK